MSQSTPESSATRAFTKFLIGFAMVEGALLLAIILAMAFEVITVEQMLPLIIGAAVIGGAVLTWRVMTLNKRRQGESAASSHFPQNGSDHSGDNSGLSGLGEKDPMAKYRNPNR